MEPIAPNTGEFAAFNRACTRRGLTPEGFDVRSATIDAGVTDVLVLLGGREYRYANVGGDPSWAEKFFIDIGDEGDSGEDVEVATSEEERESPSR